VTADPPPGAPGGNPATTKSFGKVVDGMVRCSLAGKLKAFGIEKRMPAPPRVAGVTSNLRDDKKEEISKNKLRREQPYLNPLKQRKRFAGHLQ
jgi:hypothetical protein